MPRVSTATADSIEYARATYPEIGFHICDVLDVPRTVTREFDLIYMLNAFYAFPRQREALAAMRKVAKPGARSSSSSITPSASNRRSDIGRTSMMPFAIRLPEIACDAE